MKKIKIFTSLSFLILLTSCASYTPKGVESRYTKLSKNFDLLVDDEINEKKRAKLEKEFKEFSEGIEHYKSVNNHVNSDYLDSYLEKINLKIQYLNDLKD